MRLLLRQRAAGPRPAIRPVPTVRADLARIAVPEPPHLVTDLKTLCLATMATEWRPLAAQATRECQPPAEYLAQLVHLEVTGRRERRIQRRLQEARFPMLKTLDAFQFDAQPGLDRDAILQLCGGAFVAEAANVVLVGGVGTGKTHLAIALGMACCQHDYRVRFLTAAELTTLLVEAQQQGRLARKLDQLARFDVVILDELGYVPFDKAGADLLFGFISRRYERGSLVVTTNLPFARWSEVPGCDRRRGRHRPHRAPCHRADDQQGQLPPQGRPTEPDGSRSTEENASMGTRRDDHPTEGSLFTLPKGPFSPCHFQLSKCRMSQYAVRHAVRGGRPRLPRAGSFERLANRRWPAGAPRKRRMT